MDYDKRKNPLNSYTPAWATESEQHFERYGLLAERRADGLTVCNLWLIGGLAGSPVPINWSEPGEPRFLLALSIVHRMMNHPDESASPMAPLFTKRYISLVRGTITLDDGTKVTPWHTALARMFEKQYLEPEHDSFTLTIPIEVITKSLTFYLRELYPDPSPCR